MTDVLDHELIDAGAGRRLDRFGSVIVDRPAPGASDPPADDAAWATADYRFTRGGGWFAGPGMHSPPVDDAVTWQVGMGALRLEARLSPSGQVGLFPEHAELVPWLRRQAGAHGPGRAPEARSVTILNLFAHSGLVSLALAREGAAITHVDASRPAVAQGRRNAELSGLAEHPIRWIVDDAIGFTEREARRGRTYDGVILDPPAYGHAGAQTWQLRSRIGELLETVARVLDPAGAFILITAHSTGVQPDDLGLALREAMIPGASRIETGDITLKARSGVRLPGGAYARSGVRGPGGAA